LPGVTDLDLYRDALIPQLQIRVNRRAIARHGLSMEDAQQTIETALAGTVATEFWERERPVPVRVILAAGARSDVDTISSLLLKTPGGGRVALKTSADIGTASGIASINREGNSRYLALKFNVEGRRYGIGREGCHRGPWRRKSRRQLDTTLSGAVNLKPGTRDPAAQN